MTSLTRKGVPISLGLHARGVMQPESVTDKRLPQNSENSLLLGDSRDDVDLGGACSPHPTCDE
eukprot:6213724-Pleurochrysis_carterae.AAC.3